jgi:hypothetical protein
VNERPSFEILPVDLSIRITSPAETRSRLRESIIFPPRSYTVSISVVLMVSLPVFAAPVWERSIWISTTSPVMSSVSSLMRMPMDLRKAWVRASVFDISREKTSEAEIMLKGTSSPSVWAMPILRIEYTLSEERRSAHPWLWQSCQRKAVQPSKPRDRLYGPPAPS